MEVVGAWAYRAAGTGGCEGDRASPSLGQQKILSLGTEKVT